MRGVPGDPPNASRIFPPATATAPQVVQSGSLALPLTGVSVAEFLNPRTKQRDLVARQPDRVQH